MITIAVDLFDLVELYWKPDVAYVFRQSLSRYVSIFNQKCFYA